MSQRICRQKWKWVLHRRNMSTNHNRELYEVKSDINETAWSGPKQIPPKRRIFGIFTNSSSVITFIFSMTVWTLCGHYAYKVWKNKEKDEEKYEEEDDTGTEKTVVKHKTPWEIIQPKTLLEKGIIMGSEGCEEYRKTHLRPNMVENENVLVNDESGHVEVIRDMFGIGKMVITIPFHRIQQDDDGNLMFDEFGFPVEKPHRVIELFNYINDSVSSFVFD